jgi:AAA+ superfamily predicted ATPase
MRFDATTRALLSAVDGKSSFEGLLRLCATPHVQALRVFLALRFLGIIEFEEPGGA